MISMMKVCFLLVIFAFYNRTNTAQQVFAQSMLYHLAVNLVKASFMIQYIRIFSLVKWVKYSCYTLLVVVTGAAAWGVFGAVFLCNPIPKYWDTSILGDCGDAALHFLDNKRHWHCA